MAKQRSALERDNLILEQVHHQNLILNSLQQKVESVFQQGTANARDLDELKAELSGLRRELVGPDGHLLEIERRVAELERTEANGAAGA